jgi:hypothetical protein
MVIIDIGFPLIRTEPNYAEVSGLLPIYLIPPLVRHLTAINLSQQPEQAMRKQ